MCDSIINKFQDSVSEVLIRHKSILDIISKYQESCSKVNRSIIKSATSCGCIHVDGKKQTIPETISYKELHDFMNNHVSGDLCDICKDKIEKEMGNHLFYLVALCNTLDLDLHEIFKKQCKSIDTLGKYSLY
ncbi:nucleoside triphosphate pyrophosphohydrolase family protein [Marinisporobacter balticus]|uniref:DUF1573 domain-containing protein n=1 Tax=Marinisporobacter balticus TaxID=2018667 RepID=A0A4R2KGS8_9FIRM|nr:DUF1573 domain-containing protein [Marinisporobacter balticus]TCO69676.1 hypothetical protein EV214_13012 [Marinisporobacter balticus]